MVQAAGLRLPVSVVLDGHAGSRKDLVVVGPSGAREVDGLIATIVCGQELGPNLSWLPPLILAVQCLQLTSMDALVSHEICATVLMKIRHAKLQSNLTGKPYP